MMGGNHDVQSEEGRGSVFSFRAPFVLPEERPATSPATTEQESGARRLAVLLAEDNPINQIYVQELLEMEGHTVVVAHTGRRALEALRRQPFDVILMVDGVGKKVYRLAGLAGRNASRRVRK